MVCYEGDTKRRALIISVESSSDVAVGVDG